MLEHKIHCKADEIKINQAEITEDQEDKPPLPNKLLFLFKDWGQGFTVYNLP